ncbi:MAG: Kelch repeat-containing protein [Candidatus Thorarchaeota archaeon]
MRAFISILLSVLVIMTLATPQHIGNMGLNRQAVITTQVETPTGRYLPGFVYDLVNERVMMFGGATADTPLGDSWGFDLSTGRWTELDFETSPMPRHSTAMVYDSIDEVIVLFGGYDGSERLADTWIFNCTTEMWIEVTPTISPPPRMNPAMVYDSVNDKVILFSGYHNSGPDIADTWVYDIQENEWMEMDPLVVPHARYGASFVFDDVTERMLIFGGNSDGFLDDTWGYSFANDTWTDLGPSTHPPELKWSSSVYDSSNHKMILFGGDEGSHNVNRTWIYDPVTNEWEEREPEIAPPPREGFAFTFDTTNEKAILFSGTSEYPDLRDDVWSYEFSTNTWEEIAQIADTSTEAPDILVVLLIVAPIIGITAIASYILLKRSASKK